jgi:hypothetical protein
MAAIFSPSTVGCRCSTDFAASNRPATSGRSDITACVGMIGKHTAAVHVDLPSVPIQPLPQEGAGMKWTP